MHSSEIREKIIKYGFTEISELLIFLEYFCYSEMSPEESKYVLEKLKKCIALHDNGSLYFRELHELSFELERWHSEYYIKNKSNKKNCS